MKNNAIYNSLDTVILRTPIFPFCEHEKETEYESNLFNEALYIASSDFYNTMKSSKKEKVLKTLYKYHSRACSRCTPFGVFSTCSIISLSHQTNIVLSPIDEIIRNVRLDVQCVFEIIKYLENKKSIKFKLKYYPNDSLYSSYNSLRYYEVVDNPAGEIEFKIVSVLKTEYLDKILHYAIAGKTIDDIVNVLISDEISRDDAIEYIEDLIKSQILISDLRLGENGPGWFYHIANFLKEIQEKDFCIEEVEKEIRQINNGSCDLTNYRKITEILGDINITPNKHGILHVDALRPCVSSTLSKDIAEDLLCGVNFLCKTCHQKNNYLLDNFRIRFLDRYDSQQVPLLSALDADLGLDYLIQNNGNEKNGLLDGLVFPEIEKDRITTITPLKKLLLKKYVEALKNNLKEIVFEENELPNYFINKDVFPVTLPVLCSIYRNKSSNADILIKAMGSSTASCVLSRFSHLDPTLDNLIKNILQIEKKYYKDYIVAEIAYLPQNKAGNILVKDLFRDYEILIQSKGNDMVGKISIADLTIQLVDNHFVLKSKTYNKRIIPFLSSAYNYQNSKLPILRFLCDLQFDGLEVPYIFDWGEEYAELDYFPQIRYKNCIISRQKWRIRSQEFLNLNTSDTNILIKQICEWREKRNLPAKLIYAEFDNELLIDFNHQISIKVFLDILKTKDSIMLEEFLFSAESAIVTDQKDLYCNEFIFLLNRGD